MKVERNGVVVTWVGHSSRSTFVETWSSEAAADNRCRALEVLRPGDSLIRSTPWGGRCFYVERKSGRVVFQGQFGDSSGDPLTS